MEPLFSALVMPCGVLSFPTLAKGTNNAPLQCITCIAKIYFILSADDKKDMPGQKG